MGYASYKYLLIFLGSVLLFYTVMPRRFKWTVLLAASYGFYWISSGKLAVFLIAATAAVYLGGILLDKIGQTAALGKKGLEKEEKRQLKSLISFQKKAVVALTLCIIFGMLLVIKYSGFFANLFNRAAAFSGVDISLPVFSFVMPLGISYYTLQAAGYLIDVYRGKYRASYNFGKVALFLSFFPQIVQGPIGRFDRLADPLYEGHRFSYENVPAGLQLIAWGLFKKMVIADRLNIFVADVFGNYTERSGSLILAAGVLYTLQIYAEFSACMDIVTGSAQLFSVPLDKNFERPFFSKSVSEFWRRWHITLGAWLKDYVFYPLSFSPAFMGLGRFTKKHFGEYAGSMVPATLALFFTWALIGFWHGAGLRFIVYGMYYYAFMVAGMWLEPLIARAFSVSRIKRDCLPLNIIRMFRTAAIVVGGMMLFRAGSVTEWTEMIRRIFTDFGSSEFMQAVVGCGMDIHDFYIVGIGAAAMLAVSILQEKGINIRESVARQYLPVRWAAYAGLILAIVVFGAYGTGYDAVDFIYAQF